MEGISLKLNACEGGPVPLLVMDRFVIPEIEPRPRRALRMLLLGSYDSETTKLMRNLIRILIDTYDPQHENKGRRLVPLLVEDVRNLRVTLWDTVEMGCLGKVQQCLHLSIVQ